MSETKKSKKQKIIPRLRPLPYTLQDLEVTPKKPTLTKQITIQSTDYYSNDDNPCNKRGFKYKPCRPNPFFQSSMYSTSDLPPYKTRFSLFDKSPGTFIDESCMRVTAFQGWRSARSNIAIREGKWFVEFKIVKANDGDPGNSHVRFGLARREASLEAPVGFDGYGYGFRDKGGNIVHLSKPTEFLINEDLKTGDCIGLLIELPDLETQMNIAELQIQQQTVSEPIPTEVTEKHKKVDKNIEKSLDEFREGVIRDQIPIKYKNQLFFEQYDYQSSTEMEHLLNPVTVFGEKAIPDKEKFKPCRLPQSSITFYKNGVNKGIAFEGLYTFLPPSSEQRQNKRDAKKKLNVSKEDGSLGYYPMASCFNKGVVELSPGPEVQYLPDDLKESIANGTVKLYCDRYDEKVIEDYVNDLIDEVTNQYLDELEATL